MSRSTAVVVIGRWWINHSHQRFPLRFLLVLGLGAGVGAVLSPTWPLFIEATARAVVWMCSLVGISTVLGPDHVLWFEGGAFSYGIVEECTALTLALLYGAAVLAYPATRRQQAVGLAVGIPALFALNLVRLVTLAWVGLHTPARFEAVHLYWWQGFLIAFVGLGWFAWARFVAHEGRRSHGGTARIREVFGALGVFTICLGVMGALGSAGGVEIWRRIFQPVAYTVVGTLKGVPISSDTEAVWELFQWSYATVVGIIALFLSTPRVRWERKVRGALLVGLPVAFGIETVHFVATFLAGSLEGTAETSVSVLRLAGRISAGIVVWYAWARRDWARAFAGRKGYRCPYCGRKGEDLLSHVQRGHRWGQAEILAEVFKDYPELRKQQRAGEIEIGTRSRPGSKGYAQIH